MSSVKPKTIERAFELWPEWGGLIKEARAKFHFKVDFTREEYEHWEKTVGWKLVIKECFKTLKSLWLPWWFDGYWLQCFWGGCKALAYSSGNRPWDKDLSSMEDKRFLKPYYPGCTITFSPYSNGELGVPWPFIFSTPFPIVYEQKVEEALSENGEIFYGAQEFMWGGKRETRVGLFKKLKDGRYEYKAPAVFKPPAGSFTKIHFSNKQAASPALMRLEMPLFLATDDILEEALKQIRLFRQGFLHYLGHPLNKIAQGVKFSTGEEQMKKKLIIKEETLAFREGKYSFTQLLQREFRRDKEIQETLSNYEKKYGRRHPRYKNEARQLAHKVYLRVRRWLKRGATSPGKPNRGWWWETLGFN